MAAEMTIKHEAIVPGTALSDHDKAFMVINYPRARLDPAAREWTLSHALDVMGVPNVERHSMLFARPEDVRKQFAIWKAQQAILLASDNSIELPREDEGGMQDEEGADYPSWFRRACADLLRRKAVDEDQDTPGMVARAVFSSSDNLWDNESVRNIHCVLVYFSQLRGFRPLHTASSKEPEHKWTRLKL